MLLASCNGNTNSYPAGTNRNGVWYVSSLQFKTGDVVTFYAVHPTEGTYYWPVRVRFTIRELESLSLDRSAVSLARGASTTLTPTVLFTDGITSGQTLGISAAQCSWSSDNTSVCTVSNGKVTAKASGSAWVTCSLTRGSKTVSARCRVTIQ